MARELRIAASVYFSVMTVCLLCVAGCGRRHGLEETERRGDTIIVALEKYFADQAQYPPFLNDLTPQYLQEVPAPTWGLETWEYSTTGNEFLLGVNESTNTGDGDAFWFRYLGEEHGWQTGD